MEENIRALKDFARKNKLQYAGHYEDSNGEKFRHAVHKNEVVYACLMPNAFIHVNTSSGFVQISALALANAIPNFNDEVVILP